MSNSSPNRRYLTDWLKLTLSVDLFVDVINAPKEGGWDNDPRQVGSSYFPYTVLVPLSSESPEGPISDISGMWSLPYSMTSYGVSAFAVEDQADTARRIVLETKRALLDLGGVSWKVMEASINSIGAVDINRSVEPPELSQRDVVMLRITKKET
jgi:hypothetical protein